MNLSMNLGKFHARAETGSEAHFTRCQISFWPANQALPPGCINYFLPQDEGKRLTRLILPNKIIPRKKEFNQILSEEVDFTISCHFHLDSLFDQWFFCFFFFFFIYIYNTDIALWSWKHTWRLKLLLSNNDNKAYNDSFRGKRKVKNFMRCLWINKLICVFSDHTEPLM